MVVCCTYFVYKVLLIYIKILIKHFFPPVEFVFDCLMVKRVVASRPDSSS